MTVAPDYVEPVVGYRAWRLGEDGLLRPWTFTQLPWSPGVNHAVCARDERHKPPVADCMCGLYGLSEPSDRRLHLQGEQVVGAIAAWGDLEAHRTGFRAETACIVALARPVRPDDEHLELLELAAQAYAVPLVPAELLSAEAQCHGAPLPAELWPPSWPVAPAAKAVPPVDPGGFVVPARGIALDTHLWVETALGAVVLGPTRALGDRLETAPRVTLPEPGAVVAAGDRLATIDGTYSLHAPFGGRVLAVNTRLVDDPALARRDPEGGGWLVRMAPTAWEHEASAVTWGRAASRHYAASLERDAVVRGDAFADVRVERLRAMPPVRSAGDVLAELRRRRAAPRFADAAAVEVELGGRLRDTLAASPSLRAQLGRLDAVVGFGLREPTASLILDLRRGARVRVDDGGDVDADLVLSCTAEDAYRWFTGVLDAATALRAGELRSNAELGATLRTLAVLKHLRVEAWPSAPDWAT